MTGYFIFDDIDTRDYEGIHVAFSEIDTTPKRVYQTINIPSRNGAFYIDEGRYEDAQHSYDIIALDKNAGSDLINALASKIGYHRLEDSFNTNEFYSAVLDIEIIPNIASERDRFTFKVTFTRKPQRWLKSGENAITVASGDVISNPTLFESSPILEVEGYGTMEFNGYDVELENAAIGRVVLAPAGTDTMSSIRQINYANSGLINAGDVVTYGDIYIPFGFTTAKSKGAYMTSHSLTYEVVSGSMTITDKTIGSRNLELSVAIDGGTFENPSGEIVDVASANVYVSGQARQDGATVPFEMSFSVKIRATKSYIQMGKFNYTSSIDMFRTLQRSGFTYGEISAESTQNLLGHPTYIDCDLGEVYKIEDGQYASLNSYVDLGSDLPKLSSGANTITFDDTITDLKIVPRWWKV